MFLSEWPSYYIVIMLGHTNDERFAEGCAGEDAAGKTYRISYPQDGKAVLARSGKTEPGQW